MKLWIAVATAGVGIWASVASAATLASGAGFECLLEPWQVVEVRSPVEGTIVSIPVARGDLVRKGQTLVELHSAPERLALESARFRAQTEGQVETARNRIEYATKKLERMTYLQKENFMSAQARDEADAEKRLAESELKTAVEAREVARIEARRAQEQLALRVVHAPFAGVIVDRMLNPGELAEAGSGRKPVLKLAQIDPMRADVALPASMFGQVRVGAPATLTAVVGGGTFSGKVRSVDRVIDAASATFVARIEIPNPEAKVPGGSRCQASIHGVAPPALVRH